MEPLVRHLEVEEGITVKRYEVWEDNENAKTMELYDKGLCGGVPFFFNTDTYDFICGAVPYGALKAWALGRQNHDGENL